MNVDKKRVVYAFPHLGAGAAIYNAWANQANASDAILFKAMEIPGRGTLGAEENIQELDAFINKLADDMHFHYIQNESEIGEWITFGHSFGGVISVAVTQILEKKYGMSPAFSIISASPAPCVQQDEGLHLLSDEQILQKVRNDNGTPDVLLDQPLIAKRLIKQFRSDYLIKSQFSDLKALKVKQPLILITASEDFDVPCEDVLAWKNHSSEPVSHTEIEGGHFAIYKHWDVVRKKMLRGLSSKQVVF